MKRILIIFLIGFGRFNPENSIMFSFNLSEINVALFGFGFGSLFVFICVLNALIFYEYKKQPSFLTDKTRSLQRSLIKLVLSHFIVAIINVFSPLAMCIINLHLNYLDICFAGLLLSQSLVSIFDCCIIIFIVKPYRAFITSKLQRKITPSTAAAAIATYNHSRIII